MRIIHNLPADDYHSIHALSKSGLDQLAKSPMHYQHWLTNKQEPTEAMKIGTAVHMAVLEPIEFGAKYGKFTGDRRTKEGKAAYEEFQASGKTALSSDAWDQIQGIAQSVQSHQWWMQNTRSLQTEVSCIDRTPDGIDIKARMDGVTNTHILDIKTTSDASPSGFAKAIANFRYHWQAAWYRRFIDLPFIFIAVEKDAPHAVGIYEIDAEALAVANNDIETLLNTYRDCRTYGSMPGYRSEVVTLSLPKFVKPIEA
jgi:exodeoxyribonuclease VIII